MANSQKFYDDVNIIIDRYSSWDFSTQNERHDSSVLDALVSTIGEDGSWGDVDYETCARSNWKCFLHLRRILFLSKAWYADKNEAYLRTALKALAFWRKLSPVNPNWWWNVIGLPMVLGRTALTLDSVLSGDEREWIAEAIHVQEPEAAKTGQNLVWMAEIRLCRGLFMRDEELIRSGLDDILSVVVVSDSGEGILNDWSFHQHGAQMQFGNYGLSFICDHTRLIRLLRGTIFEYPQDKRAIIESLVSESYSWLIWNGMLDVACLGRQIFPNGQSDKAAAVDVAINNLKAIGWTPPLNRVGFRYFPCSAYAVYRTKNWMASIRASTSSIIGVETHVNEDNAKGMCMADGALCTYVTGCEYENVFPLWDDWRMIPGVTAYAGKPLERKRRMNEADDVVASETPEGGTFSFTFKREGLVAHKKWTFSERGILCEGEGISAEDTSYEVMTSVEEAIAAPNAGIVYERPNEICFRNGDIEYIVYGPKEAIRFEIADRSGSYSTFMLALDEEIVSGKVFSLRISHGFAPKGASYRYEVKPLSK